MELWWSLVGAAIPTFVAGQAFRFRRRRSEEQRLKNARGREKSSDDIFVCERVCTSKRMLKKVGAFRRRRSEEQRLKNARGREKSSDDIFVCERVCTSKRMLKKVGAFSKDPTPDTCVTVCFVSELDACADACARTVCVNPHQVPNWNDICLRRCQSECLRLSNSYVN